MKILKYHLIQEMDGISPDDVVITNVEFCNNNIKICYIDYNDGGDILECEHIILNIENKPSEQTEIIVITGYKEPEN